MSDRISERTYRQRLLDGYLDEVFAELTGSGGAVVVGRAGKPVAILTRSDLLEFLAAQRTQVEA